MILVLLDIYRNRCSYVLIFCTSLCMGWPSTPAWRCLGFILCHHTCYQETKELRSDAGTIPDVRSGPLAHRSPGEKHDDARIGRVKYTQNTMAARLSLRAPQGGEASPTGTWTRSRRMEGSSSQNSAGLRDAGCRGT